MRKLLAIFLLFSFVAEGQVIRRTNAFYVSNQIVLGPLLLDSFTNAASAFSLRKLKEFYSGYAIRVRRSSDNSEQDIGFNGKNLDTISLKAFVGSGSGYVTKWYDQSDNVRNATQQTSGSQPKIILNGEILKSNNIPVVNFYQGQYLITDNFAMTGQICSYVAFNIHTAFTSGSVSSWGEAATGKWRNTTVAGSGSTYYNYVSAYSENLQLSQIAINTNVIQSSFFDKTNGKLYGKINNGSTINANRTIYDANSSILYLGKNNTNEYLNVNIFESIYYNKDNFSDVNNIVNNINRYYSIY